MVPSSQLNKPCEQTFNLPMNGVTKSSSTSTKLRVVFDASAHTYSNISLNQSLFVSPTLFPNLDQILLKFRMYPVALSADISKMYRAVEPEEVDRDLHRFLWRADPKSPVTDYRMTRVTFGVFHHPSLLSKPCNKRLKTLVTTIHWPNTVMELFYVDDFSAGADPWSLSYQEATMGIPRGHCRLACLSTTPMELMPTHHKGFLETLVHGIFTTTSTFPEVEDSSDRSSTRRHSCCT